MRVKRSVLLGLAMLLGGAVVSCLLSPLGAAATDTTRPQMKLPAYATFVSGSAIGPMALDADGFPSATDGIWMRVAWSASDASGVCGYRTREELGAGVGRWSAWGSQKVATISTTDYDDQFGGGADKFEGLDVQARDCAGNTTTKFVSFFPKVFQENGDTFSDGPLMGTAYAGAWGTSTCVCWSGGATRRTSGNGARATFTLTVWGVNAGHAVALVMERAPDRGKAQVLIDGAYRTTVDTYAASPTHRSVVWVGKLPLGTHTLTLVNLATSGRPRIDIDAVLFSSRSSE
jgi:hypothetical protein